MRSESATDRPARWAAIARGAFAPICGAKAPWTRSWRLDIAYIRRKGATDDRRGRRSRVLTQQQLTFASAAARPRAARRPRPAAPTRRQRRLRPTAARTD